MPAWGVPFQRWVLIGLAPLMAVVFWSGATDPVNLPKATLAVSAALLLVAVSAVRAVSTRRVSLPLTPALWAALALFLGLIAATVTSDVPGQSFAGTLGRSDGLLLYGGCLALFAVGLRALDADSARWLLRGLLAGGLFAVTYGLLQYVGVDAINWADVGLSPVIGTFGNPDFESAYIGIVLPTAAWGAVTSGWQLGWRVASGALAAGCLLTAALSSSIQGVLAGAAGLAVLAVAMLLNRGGRVLRVGLGVLAAGVVVMVAVAMAGLLAGVGPGERLTSAGSLTARKWYWGSALRLWQQHPLTGVGLDRYGAHYRSVRPAAAAAASNYSDAAHSVPLHLLSTGGLVVALPYVALVLCVGWALVRGLRRSEGGPRLLLGGLGGAWLAYQVQSLVSIDQPALAVTHWVLAAAVVAVGSPPRMVERLLPGAVVPTARKGRRPAAPAAPVAVWSGATLAVGALVVALAATAWWQTLKPLGASHAARTAAVDVAAGDGNGAFDRLNSATRLAPYEAAYWLQRGRFLEQVKQPARAASSYATGVRHDPWSYDLLVAGAGLAKVQQDDVTVARYSRLLDKVDPSGGWRAAVGG